MGTAVRVLKTGAHRGKTGTVVDAKSGYWVVEVVAGRGRPAAETATARSAHSCAPANEATTTNVADRKRE